jgi:hypothetical protein
VLDGTAAADYLSIANAAWQSVAGTALLVWSWVDVDTMLAADMTVAAKYDGVNQCGWWLRLDTGAAVFELVVNGVGPVGNDVVCASTVTVGTSGFYFVAAHYEPGTSVTLGVAAASAGTLVGGTNVVTASIPAALHASTAQLTIGSISAGGGNWWNGFIGATAGRSNVPVTNITSHMARIYAATHWLYGG